MMKPLFALVSLLALPGITYGDPVPQTLRFDSVSGTYDGHYFAADAYHGPYYISPYFGHLGSNPSGSLVLFCLDFDHHIGLPDQTTAVVRTLPITEAAFLSDNDHDYQFETLPSGTQNAFLSGASPTGANISSLTAYQRYEAAIYLLHQDLTLTPPPVQDSRKRALYQYALWELFLQNGPPAGVNAYSSAIASINAWEFAHISGATSNNFSLAVNALVLDAFTQVTQHEASLKGLLSSYAVVSSTTNPSAIGSKYQEFLTPIPEPASVVLLGTVVIGVGLILRRRTV